MTQSVPDDVISWENMIYIADLLESSGSKAVALLGGEPTLHPDFADFVVYLHARDFHVHIFTSGIMSDAKLKECEKKLLGIPREQISFTCNINNPRLCPKRENEKLDLFLRSFGHLVTPGFNIYTVDYDFSFLFDFINRYGLMRSIRIGLAHPITGENNLHIAVHDMRKIIDRFLSYIPSFERFKVDPGFDCGFPLCLFTEEELGKLYKVMKGRIVFGCGPAIDIGPDMSVWSCFPLSGVHKRSLFEFNSMQEILDFYAGIGEKIRSEAGGLFEDCDGCTYRAEKLCSGGCLAHVLNRFQQEPPVRMEKFVS
jgi:radical SAM protein with 4Fe4S-binding SPASM domain